jgi:uncharacterized damage-inducible protein DinB
MLLVTHQDVAEAAPRATVSGVYHDQWRKTQAGWRLAHRAAHLDQDPRTPVSFPEGWRHAAVPRPVLRELIETIYRDNAWANQRIPEATARLSGDEYRAKGDGGFGSVHETLVHIMGAQWTWLCRWKGTSPPTMLNAAAFPDLLAVSRRWADIESDTQEFIAAVGEEELQRRVEYLNTEGERWAYPLWQQMLHQVNHATQHRSEVAIVLTRCGQSPGWLDLLYFLDVEATAG